MNSFYQRYWWIKNLCIIICKSNWGLPDLFWASAKNKPSIYSILCQIMLTIIRRKLVQVSLLLKSKLQINNFSLSLPFWMHNYAQNFIPILEDIHDSWDMTINLSHDSFKVFLLAEPFVVQKSVGGDPVLRMPFKEVSEANSLIN